MMVDTIKYTNKQEMLVMDIVLKYTAAQMMEQGLEALT